MDDYHPRQVRDCVEGVAEKALMVVCIPSSSPQRSTFALTLYRYDANIDGNDATVGKDPHPLNSCDGVRYDVRLRGVQTSGTPQGRSASPPCILRTTIAHKHAFWCVALVNARVLLRLLRRRCVLGSSLTRESVCTCPAGV